MEEFGPERSQAEFRGFLWSGCEEVSSEYQASPPGVLRVYAKPGSSYPGQHSAQNLGRPLNRILKMEDASIHTRHLSIHPREMEFQSWDGLVRSSSLTPSPCWEENSASDQRVCQNHKAVGIRTPTPTLAPARGQAQKVPTCYLCKLLPLRVRYATCLAVSTGLEGYTF
jgi:hypothetical protein